MLNLKSVAAHQQIPLIHVVHEDDELLANSPDAGWYKILQNLPWEQYRKIAAAYYNALYHFNKSKTHSQKISNLPEEQKETATQHLLFDRATMDETAPVLLEEEFITDILPTVSSSMIAPPMAKRFKAIMKRRPSVERMIKRLKCDLGNDRLKKRSNSSFQAYLDKTMIAFHILLRS